MLQVINSMIQVESKLIEIKCQRMGKKQKKENPSLPIIIRLIPNCSKKKIRLIPSIKSISYSDLKQFRLVLASVMDNIALLLN